MPLGVSMTHKINRRHLSRATVGCLASAFQPRRLMDRTAAVGVIVVVAGLEVNSSQRLLRAGRGGRDSHMLAEAARLRAV